MKSPHIERRRSTAIFGLPLPVERNVIGSHTLEPPTQDFLQPLVRGDVDVLFLRRDFEVAWMTSAFPFKVAESVLTGMPWFAATGLLRSPHTAS